MTLKAYEPGDPMPQCRCTLAIPGPARGKHLDRLGTLYDVFRKESEKDAAYRKRILDRGRKPRKPQAMLFNQPIKFHTTIVRWTQPGCNNAGQWKFQQPYVGRLSDLQDQLYAKAVAFARSGSPTLDHGIFKYLLYGALDVATVKLKVRNRVVAEYTVKRSWTAELKGGTK